MRVLDLWHSETENNNITGHRIWAFFPTTLSVQEIILLNMSINVVNLILVLKKILNEAVFHCGSGNKIKVTFKVLSTKEKDSNQMTNIVILASIS